MLSHQLYVNLVIWPWLNTDSRTVNNDLKVAYMVALVATLELLDPPQLQNKCGNVFHICV